MNSEQSHKMLKNNLKNFIKNHLYIMLKRSLTQINAQLNIYSDRQQILDNDKWYRLIDNTFKRNLRNAHKEIRKEVSDDKYWNDYRTSIDKFREFIKQYSIESEIEEAGQSM